MKEECKSMKSKLKIRNVSKIYEEKTGIKPGFYAVEIGNGTVIL